MEADIKEQIKQKLIERKEQLEKQLAEISDKGEASFEDIEDDDDINAQEVSQYSDRLSLVAELKKHYDDVNSSLQKIEEGTYGVCKYCKKDINPKRLLARPGSGACIDCKATLQGEV